MLAILLEIWRKPSLFRPSFQYHKEVYNGCMEKIKIEHHTMSGGLWIAGWLFTIGYLQLTFWQGVIAIILWPYYLGEAMQSFSLPF